MSIYKCSMCKEDLNGPAALVNAAGRFCAGCKEEIAKRIKGGMEKWDGRCRWCGVVIREHNKLNVNGEIRQNCKACERHREWLLSCIRYSEKPYKYTKRIEEREAPIREKKEREAKERRDQIIEKQAAKPVQEKLPIPTEQPARAAMTPDDIAKVVAAVMNELLK